MPKFLLLVLTALLTACAGFDPRTIVIGPSELQALLGRDFPRQTRVLELIDVTLSAPRVRLLPERNRIATELEFSAAERLTGRPLRGSIALDHALRWEPQDGTVRLSQVRVERVNLDAGGQMLPLPAQRLGAVLAEYALDGVVLWRARPEQLQRLRSFGAGAGAIDVTPRGVEIRLGGS